MRICILSRSPTLYSTRRLIAAAQERGHGVLLVDYLRCSLEIARARPRVLYAGNEIAGVDIVMPRVASGAEAAYGAAVVRQFEMAGVRSVNSSQGIARAGDKLRCLQLLSRSGLDVPHTAIAHGSADKDLLLESVGGPPVVLKLLQGSQGSGVVLARTVGDAESVIASFQALGANFLVQEYIAEAEGRDLRVIVVGGKVVAAMERCAAPGDFRSNLHRGGSAAVVQLTAVERRIALRAAGELHLNVAGVDLIRSSRGPLVLEVNASPGLEGIEGATKLDVAGAVVKQMEKLHRLRPVNDA